VSLRRATTSPSSNEPPPPPRTRCTDARACACAFRDPGLRARNFPMSALFKTPNTGDGADTKPPLSAEQLRQATWRGYSGSSLSPWRSDEFVNPVTQNHALNQSTQTAFETTASAQQSASSTKLAQLLPPSIFFARPPLYVPRTLRPLEELPQGSAGGPNAGRAFARGSNAKQPQDVPCAYCGKPTTEKPGPDKLNGDHVFPRSQGGNNDPTNYAPACRTCNIHKGGRTPQQWYEYMGLNNLKS
jgi:HNH endonuclease